MMYVLTPPSFLKIDLVQAKVQMFYAFVGALWVYRGPQSLFEWIRDVLEFRHVDSRKRPAGSPLREDGEVGDEEAFQDPLSGVSRKRQRLVRVLCLDNCARCRNHYTDPSPSFPKDQRIHMN